MADLPSNLPIPANFFEGLKNLTQDGIAQSEQDPLTVKILNAIHTALVQLDLGYLGLSDNYDESFAFDSGGLVTQATRTYAGELVEQTDYTRDVDERVTAIERRVYLGGALFLTENFSLSYDANDTVTAVSKTSTLEGST